METNKARSVHKKIENYKAREKQQNTQSRSVSVHASSVISSVSEALKTPFTWCNHKMLLLFLLICDWSSFQKLSQEWSSSTLQRTVTEAKTKIVIFPFLIWSSVRAELGVSSSGKLTSCSGSVRNGLPLLPIKRSL